MALLCALAASLTWAAAASAAGSAEIAIRRTNGSPQNSGAPTHYSINFSCSGVEATSCGEAPTIRIPLAPTPPVPPSTPPMDSWAYAASSGIAGLILEAIVEHGEYVIKLDPAKLVPGESDTVQISVTPPNGTTPNETKWSLAPSFETEAIAPVEVETPADGEAVATARLAVSKKTLDEGAVYVRGHQVIFNITAQCSPGAQSGKLFMTKGSLVDQLPAGLEYVSATPTPAEVKAAPGGGEEIVWAYADGKSMPPGCGQESAGSGSYQVVANVPAAGTDGEVVVNRVVFSGTPIDQAAKETSATAPITLIDEPPTPSELGEHFLLKGSQAPICVEGAAKLAGRADCYAATYPGHWIRPAGNTPAFSPGSAEGRFDVIVGYQASRAYETDLVDPLPCLKGGGPEYSSLAVSGEVHAASIPVCAEPAFHTTAIWVSAPSFSAAVGEGWLPRAILTDGTTVAIPLGLDYGYGAYFDIPAAEVGKVAAIELPPNPSLTDNQLRLSTFGYADGSLKGGDTLHNVAVASAYPIGKGTAAGTARDDAKIYIEPTVVQLGISKAFGSLGAGPGGKTQLTTMGLVGSIAVPTGKTLPGDVILADLLPEGMSWSNQATSGNFTVTNGLGNPKAVAATVSREPDYMETGRELIRVALPAAPFEEEGGGFYTIRPPANFFRMEVPNETSTFNNQAEIFVAGIGRDTQPVCGGGEGTAEAEFQSNDPLDLSGTGEREQNYCESEASLAVKATGGPNFSLKKFVRGDLDEHEKSALGIGLASRGGTGVFTLLWANNGSAPLEDPVIYDILPFVGDTGVDQGQSGNPRGSEFATKFVAVVTPLPAGVEVEYSTSSDPCRPEVDPTAAPTCVEDWSSTVPADPGTVKALRFRSGQTYLPGDSFTIGVKVALPHGEVNDVAWNSAATDASAAGVPLKPAEPPKVGITAPAPLLTPTVSTSASEASILPTREVTDTVTVGNTDELNGTASWKLRGPIAPRSGSCEGLDWSAAATAASGSFAIGGDGAYPTAADTLTAHGCYSYEVTIDGPGFETAVSPAGTPGETVLVHPARATLSTTVSAASVLPETDVSDSVDVTGTEKFPGTVAWTLYGPLAPQGGSCEGLDWSTAPVFETGQFGVSADGVETTPSLELVEHGCYGYEATLAGPDLETFSSPAGSPGELVLVHPAAPTLRTAVAADSGLPGLSSADTIDIGATSGFTGTARWKLAGPVAPVGDACASVNWSGAATVATGTFAIQGDTVRQTPDNVLDEVGCYGYTVTVSGPHLATVTSPLGSAGETVIVRPVPSEPAKPVVDPPPSAELTIVKRVGNSRVKVGRPLHYTIEVADKGAGAATDTVVVDTPKSRLRFVSAKPSQGRCGHRFPLTCRLGTLAPGARATVKVIAKPPAAGKVVNVATASSPADPGRHGQVRARASAYSLVGLRLSKKVAPRSVRAGQRARYTISVANPTGVAVGKVKVCDRLPAGLAYVSSNRRAKLKGGSYCWAIARLAGHARKRIRVVARTLPGSVGRLVNTAVLSGPETIRRKARSTLRVKGRDARAGGVTG